MKSIQCTPSFPTQCSPRALFHHGAHSKSLGTLVPFVLKHAERSTAD